MQNLRLSPENQVIDWEDYEALAGAVEGAEIYVYDEYSDDHENDPYDPTISLVRKLHTIDGEQQLREVVKFDGTPEYGLWSNRIGHKLGGNDLMAVITDFDLAAAWLNGRFIELDD